jgi:hypothetical protein
VVTVVGAVTVVTLVPKVTIFCMVTNVASVTIIYWLLWFLSEDVS